MKDGLILILILFSSTLPAQIQFGSLEEVFNYADGHALAIRHSIVAEEMAITGEKESKSYLFPTISASAGYTDNITLQPTLVPAQIFNPAAPEGTFEELTFGKKHIRSAGVQVQWDILNFQKRFASQTAGIIAKGSKINIEKTRFQMYNQLASIYYSILLTRQLISVREENAKTSLDIYESARKKYEKGIIREEALNAAAIKKITSRSSLDQAHDHLTSLYIQFQSRLNTGEDIVVDDNLENFKLSDIDINGKHPEILWQEVEVNRIQSILKQKQSLHLPVVSIFYQYNYNWVTDNLLDFSGVNQLPQQYFGIKVNIPVFNGFSTRQKIMQSKYDLQIQELQLENVKLIKRKEDELLRHELEQSAQLLADNQQVLMLQQKNDIHAQNKYQSGIISLEERLDKFEDLLSVQDRYLQSLASFTLAQYKMYIRKIDFNTVEKFYGNEIGN